MILLFWNVHGWPFPGAVTRYCWNVCIPRAPQKLMLYSSWDTGETWILEEEEDSLEGYDSHTFVLNIEDWNPYAYKYCVEYQGKYMILMRSFSQKMNV